MRAFDETFIRIEHSPNFERDPYRRRMRHGASMDKQKHLFTDCFAHHTQYHNHNVQNIEFDAEDASRFVKVDNLTSCFIANYYQIPVIRCRETKEKQDYNDFLSDLASPSFSEDENIDKLKIGSNRRRYLVGSVGSGKSSFIRRVMLDLDRAETPNGGYTNINVYIDCEPILHSTNQPREIDQSFYGHVFDRMKHKASVIAPEITVSDVFGMSSFQSPFFAISSLCKEMKNLGFRFTLFIDNLDFYHYYYARYSFFDQYRDRQSNMVLENITDLLVKLRSGQYIGYCGLNVVVALRDIVWREVISSPEGVDNDYENSRTFSLELPTESTVIGSRIELFRAACTVVNLKQPGAVGDYKRLINEIDSMFLDQSDKRSPVETIYRLGQHGYRSLVEFFSTLDISTSDYELFQRFFVNQSAILLNLYFNKMKRKYCQSENHFPNIFLNDCVISYNDKFEVAHQSHAQTYWAKYLVLICVVKNPLITVKEVVNIFCRGNDGFDEHLIRHCLGSLCTANEFRCIEVPPDHEKGSLNRVRLVATNRGDELLSSYHGTPLVFSYRYLSSIVNDCWLSVPRHLLEKVYQDDLGFEHLYYTGESYRQHGVDFVKKRAVAVAYFLRLLEMTWELELERNRPDLLKRARKYFDRPNFFQAKVQCLKSVKTVLKTFDQSDASIIKSMKNIYNDSSECSLKTVADLTAYYDSPGHLSD